MATEHVWIFPTRSMWSDELNDMYLQSMFTPVTDMNHDYDNTENRVS